MIHFSNRFRRRRSWPLARAVAGVLLAVSLIGGIAGLARSGAAQRQSLAQSEFVNATERLLSTLKDIETGARGYVLIGSDDSERLF